MGSLEPRSRWRLRLSLRFGRPSLVGGAQQARAMLATIRRRCPAAGDVGDIHRFAGRDKFASWNGTAPLDASSGNQERHRLSRAGNRRINRTLQRGAMSGYFGDAQ